MTHTVETLLALAYKIRDARTYEWDVSDVVEAGNALRTALTEALQAAQPVQEHANWYCIDKSGMATLCVDEDDALQNAKLAALDWPRNAPYRAVQLVEAQPVQVPLTDDDISDIWDSWLINITDKISAIQFAREIEAAHRIGVKK